jgi:spore germination protein KA
MVLHLCKIKSIGVPYMTPIAPKIKTGNRDTFFRFPLWKMKYRPYGISGVNTIREDEKNKNSDHEKKKPELR